MSIFFNKQISLTLLSPFIQSNIAKQKRKQISSSNFIILAKKQNLV